MAEHNTSEGSPTAVYEQGPMAYNIRRAGERLQEIFGDDLEPKGWNLENNDPLRMRRYHTEANDVFIVSLRTSEMLSQSTLTSTENGFKDKRRIETVYVLETGEVGSRMACFTDDLAKENAVEEAIYKLFDTQDQLSEKDFKAQLAILAEQRQQITWDKDHIMISNLHARPGVGASANQVRDLNQLLHFISE